MSKIVAQLEQQKREEKDLHRKVLVPVYGVGVTALIRVSDLK